jgi:hypothetical protein
MESKDYLSGAIVKRSIALAQRDTEDAVTAGAALDITGVEEIVHVISASARAAGSVKIQDVQFADDSSFSVNVATFTSDDYLRKNDRSSSTSAINQTSLAAAGASKLSLANLALDGQKYHRVRTVASASASDVTYEVQTVLNYGNKPKIQS